MKFRLFVLSSAVAVTYLFAAHLHAADGVQLVQKTTSGADVRTTQVQIEKTRMRTEVVDPNGATQVIVFDGTKQVLDIINVSSKTYTEVTKADLDRMSAQMQSMMGGMTDAQRAQMEAMMRGRGMPSMAAPARPEYRRNGSDRVGRWTCDKYDGYQNGQKTSEVCTVSPAALGIGLSDLDVTSQLADFFAAVMPQVSQQIASVGRAEVQGYAGMPVKHVSNIGGRQTTLEVTDVSRQTFADSLFAIPAGFTKQDMMMGGRGRGR